MRLSAGILKESQASFVPAMSKHRIRILLADDHTLVRQGIGRLLADCEDFEIAGQASSGREAVTLAAELVPDILVMDVAMPDMNGIDATRLAKKANPRIKVLALSAHRDHAYVREMLRAGASGYLLKDATDEALIAAVRTIHRGESYLSPSVASAVLKDYRKHVRDPIDVLSAREREILQQLAEGKSNKEIASAFNISVYTVDAHRGRIMEKLDLHSISGLVRFAMRNGLVD